MKQIQHDDVTGVATIVDAPVQDDRVDQFLDIAHYVARSIQDIVVIMGGKLRIDEEDSMRSILVHNTSRGYDDHMNAETIDLPDGPHTILRFAPGSYRGEVYNTFVEIFGDTDIPQHIIDDLVAELGAKGMLATRRVLVPDVDGTDAVVIEQGMDSVYVVSAAIARADTPIAFELRSFIGGVPMASLPEIGTRLAVREYPTIENFPADLDSVLGLTEHTIEKVLERAGVGDTHIHAVLDGPLDGSQSVMFNDCPRHVATPGFVGQFRPAGRSVSFNYMVNNVDGVWTRNPYAL